ncbi:MAG TPA: putative DNA-binding domain-containing protein [Acidobacteriaceae bacterium]
MNLEAIQREMAAAVMQPLTADENMREQAADGRAMAEVAATFIAPNSRLNPFERLEIYNCQYWYRVLGALAEDFPALRAVVGGARFDALSVAYLNEYPNRSFTLRNLGSKLVEWLGAHAEFAGRRHGLAVDVARIEWAFVEAFDSAELTPLSLEQIAALGAESQLTLQPHLRLMALHYPADNLVLSLHKREKRQASEAGVGHDDTDEAPVKLPNLRRRQIWLAAHRVDFSVYYRRLLQEEFLTLSAIRAGKSLAAAMEEGFAQSRIPEQRRAIHIQRWFSEWSQLGWICAPPDGTEDA